MSYKSWARLGLGLGIAAAVHATALVASASDSWIEGAEAVKKDIRDAAVRGGRDALSKIGPWKVSYSGDIVAGKVVNLSMQPEEAFKTERESDRSFVVSLSNPDALFTQLGNLREMGVKIEIRDLGDGDGSGVCNTGVVFYTTGTRAPLNLQQLSAQNANAVNLTVSPADKAAFVRLEGEKAYFSRASGDQTPVKVTLKLSDSGMVYYFNADLPTCGTQSSPGNPGAPHRPTPRPTNPSNPSQPGKRVELVEVGRIYRTFTLSSRLLDNGDAASAHAESSKERACSNAKTALIDLVLNDVACQEKARELFANMGPTAGELSIAAARGEIPAGATLSALDDHSAQVVPNSLKSSCSCREVRYEGDKDCSFTCRANGTVTCKIPEITLQAQIR